MALTEILVPFNLDVDLIEKKLGEDAVEEIRSKIESEFVNKASVLTKEYFKENSYSSYHSKANLIINEAIENVIKDHEDEIVSTATNMLCERIAKRKAMKEAYGNLLKMNDRE